MMTMTGLSQMYNTSQEMFLLKYFIYLLLAVLGLHCFALAFSSCGRVTLHHSAQASHCRGFSHCRVSRCSDFSSWGSQALELGLSSCGTWAQLFHGMWKSLEPGIASLTLSLASGLLFTAPLGSPGNVLITQCV